MGFPQVQAGRAHYAPPSYIPLEGDQVPAGKNGWLLFLDEFNSADRSVQKAAYKLVLDRMVGQSHVAENCFMVCAGNLETDNAIVEELSSALQSRLVHIHIHVDTNEWLEWARSTGMDSRITSFIAFKPDMLHKFKPDSPDVTYPCPRTWEFTSRLIQPMTTLDNLSKVMLGGTIGEGGAVEFAAFTKVIGELPTINDIIKNPHGIPVPSEPSILYALTGSIGSNATDKNLTQLMAFIERMPIEFSVITLREIFARSPALASEQCIVDWRTKYASVLFD